MVIWKNSADTSESLPHSKKYDFAKALFTFPTSALREQQAELNHNFTIS